MAPEVHLYFGFSFDGVSVFYKNSPIFPLGTNYYKRFLFCNKFLRIFYCLFNLFLIQY